LTSSNNHPPLKRQTQKARVHIIEVTPVVELSNYWGLFMSKHHKIELAKLELAKLAQENLVSGSGCHQVSSAAGHWFFRYID
jgi:hypothetical protein